MRLEFVREMCANDTKRVALSRIVDCHGKEEQVVVSKTFQDWDHRAYTEAGAYQCLRFFGCDTGFLGFVHEPRRRQLTLVFELARGGDAFDDLYRETSGRTLWANRCQRIATARSAARDILKILCVLHERIGLVHADIKLENIVFTAAGVCRLVDYENAKPPGNYAPLQVLGTPCITPPELILHGQLWTSADTFALGLSLYEFVHGDSLLIHLHRARDFAASRNDLDVCTMDAMYKASIDEASNFRWESTGSTVTTSDHKALMDFVRTCVRACPESRLSVRDLLAHPFLA
jgi:serine/threonine protein kinase